jgi:hypothetical protein
MDRDLWPLRHVEKTTDWKGEMMRKSRAAWMGQGKFGVMVHWLAARTPQQYKHEIKDHNEAVNRFDLAGFLESFRRSGADWLIFTIGQNTGYYASPNAVLDRLAGPGYASERDLVLEIARGVKKLGKRFIAYIPAHAGFIPEAKKAFDWREETDPQVEESLRRYTEFIEEYASRYGTLLDGWWFDGVYRNHPMHRNLPVYSRQWLDAARAGNPERAVALNDASFCDGHTLPVVDDQDFLSGETEFLLQGKARFKRGMETVTPATHQPQPPAHCLWHCLVPIDVMWETGINFAEWQNPPIAWLPPKPHQIEDPLYTVDELATVVRDFQAVGGGVTFNVGIFQEGIVGPKTVDRLAELAKRMGCAS